MFHPKYLQLLRHTPKYSYGTKSIFGNAYYSDKKKIILVIDPLKDDLKKVKECIPVTETFKNKTADEIENIAFQNEQDILRTVMTEKEKDASVRSRLSKECNELFRNRKVTLCTTGLMHFDSVELQTSKKDEIRETKTLPVSKKQTPAPKSRPAKKDGGSGGITSSTNRIVRGPPGKVLFAFIPEEWPKFFMPRTGVSGFWTFLVTFGTFLVSKEYYVLEHNYYGGLSMMIVVWGAIKYVGPSFAMVMDRLVDDCEKNYERNRSNAKKVLKENIDSEIVSQIEADCQLIIMQAKRENVAMQLEAAFRKRQMYVYKIVKQRLEYHLLIGHLMNRLKHRNLVEYVTREVKKSITPEMKQKLLNVSMDTMITELAKGDKK